VFNLKERYQCKLQISPSNNQNFGREKLMASMAEWLTCVSRSSNPGPAKFSLLCLGLSCLIYFLEAENSVAIGWALHFIITQ